MKPYYQRNGITIYCGDCLEVMPGLVEPVDAIIADLPYGTTSCEWDSVISLEQLWDEYKRLIKQNGAIVLTGCEPFTSVLVMSNINWFKYDWIWKKSHATGQLNLNIQPMREHEHVLVFGQGRTTYNLQLTQKPLDKIRAPTRMGLSDCYGSQREYNRTIPVEMRAPTSVLEINSVNHGERGLHPTQKPIALMSHLVRTYTNPGELILDNTMGSGTTLVAAQNEGRQAVGIELSEEYCKIAVERLRQPSLFTLPTNNPLQPNGYQLGF